MNVHLHIIAGQIAKFLRANGGMGNGYETYAEGMVTSNVASSPSFMTKVPNDNLKTGIELQKRSAVLYDEIRQYMLENGIRQIQVEHRHVEHGCFKTVVRSCESHPVNLW